MFQNTICSQHAVPMGAAIGEHLAFVNLEFVEIVET